jgi:hypothetical protein
MARGEWDTQRTTTHPERLIAAADAILLAAQKGPKGAVLMWKDDAHPSSDGFSSSELVDAMAFLQRLGLVAADGSIVENRGPR